jgi:RNA polymerase sigma factor (sigma-70 family)
VTGWQTLGRDEDRRMAQALRDATPGAVAAVYDAYGERMFDYAHALLRDEQDAAGAVHNTVIAAQGNIAKLREPERFRAWLYTLLRNDCLRRLNLPERPIAGHEAAQSDDPFMDADDRERREDSRRVVRSALGGLTGRQREAVDLAIRHGLDAEDLSGVLGISTHQATELQRQSRADLDDALSAAAIARTGRHECPSISALVADDEWPLRSDTTKKLIRHIEVCPVCGERRKRKVSTARLLQSLPIAMVPDDLRMHVVDLAGAPDQHETRMLISQEAEPFDVWGWPMSVERQRRSAAGARSSSGGGHRLLWPAVGAAAAVVLIVGAVFMLLPGGSKPAGDSTNLPATSYSPSISPSSSPLPSVSSSSPRRRHRSPSPAPTTTVPEAPPVTTTAPAPTHTRSKKPSPSPTPSKTTSPPSTPTPTPSGIFG